MAGASEVMVSSSRRWVLMHELRESPEPTLEELMQHVSPCDLLLVEGFKKEAIPKLEVYRATLGKPLLFPEDPHIVAVAGDVALTQNILLIDINNHAQVSDFVLKHTGIK